jgi:Zn-dependent peptidase ImmA (M78 family)
MMTGTQSVQDSVSKIRFLMAHELGHICLNADKIQLGLIGSLALDPDAERDANIFAKELLRLRDERNKNFHNRA